MTLCASWRAGNQYKEYKEYRSGNQVELGTRDGRRFRFVYMVEMEAALDFSFVRVEACAFIDSSFAVFGQTFAAIRCIFF